jgi:lyso-ornithine lipid O-acyltransferase
MQFRRAIRSAINTLKFVALLLAAAIDGRIRHALGLIHDGPEGAIWIHRWCRRIVRSLDIEYDVDGLAFLDEPNSSGFRAVVSNHLSYVDILVMSAIRPFVMVAKSEVKGWPLLGWLTAQAGTVYVDRGGKPTTYPLVNAAMAKAYRSGLPVLFFPEGTTTDGKQGEGGVLPFRRGLFHSVLKDHVQVRTAAIRYELTEDNGSATVAHDICWWGDTSFVPHLVRFLSLRGVRVSVRFGEAVQGTDRFVLSENARATVAGIYLGMSPCLSSCKDPFFVGSPVPSLSSPQTSASHAN